MLVLFIACRHIVYLLLEHKRFWRHIEGVPIVFFEVIDVLVKLDNCVNKFWGFIARVPAQAMHLANCINHDDSFLSDLLIFTKLELEGIVAHRNDWVTNTSEFSLYDMLIRLQDKLWNEPSIFCVFSDYDSAREAVDLVYLCHGARISKLIDDPFV